MYKDIENTLVQHVIKIKKVTRSLGSLFFYSIYFYFHISSALGPYTPGIGMSFNLKSTPSCALW